MHEKQLKPFCSVLGQRKKTLSVSLAFFISFYLLSSPLLASAAEVIAQITSVEDTGDKTYRLVVDKGIKDGIQLNDEGKIYVMANGQRRFSPGSGMVDRSLDKSSDILADIQSFPPKVGRDIVVFQVADGIQLSDSQEEIREIVQDGTSEIESAPEEPEISGSGFSDISLEPSEPASREIVSETPVEAPEELASSAKGIEVTAAEEDNFSSVSLDPSQSVSNQTPSNVVVQGAGAEEDDDLGGLGAFQASLMEQEADKKQKADDEQNKLAREEREKLSDAIRSHGEKREWRELKKSVKKLESYPDLTADENDLIQEMNKKYSSYTEVAALLDKVGANIDAGNLKSVESDLKKAGKLAQNLGNDEYIKRVKKYRSSLKKKQHKAKFEGDCRKQTGKIAGIKKDFSDEKVRRFLKNYASCSSSKFYEANSVRVLKDALKESQAVSERVEEVDGKCRRNVFSNLGAMSRLDDAIEFFSNSGMKSYAGNVGRQLAEVKKLCTSKEQIYKEEKQRKLDSLVSDFRDLKEDVEANSSSMDEDQIQSYRSDLVTLEGQDLYDSCSSCRSINSDVEDVLDKRKSDLAKRNTASSYIP